MGVRLVSYAYEEHYTLQSRTHAYQREALATETLRIDKKISQSVAQVREIVPCRTS
jgi:hypothetical protein